MHSHSHTHTLSLSLSLTHTHTHTHTPVSTVALEEDREEDRELDWVYYMAGSTAAAVVWALITLVAMLFVVEVLRDKQKKDLDELKRKLELCL